MKRCGNRWEHNDPIPKECFSKDASKWDGLAVLCKRCVSSLRDDARKERERLIYRSERNREKIYQVALKLGIFIQ